MYSNVLYEMYFQAEQKGTSDIISRFKYIVGEQNVSTSPSVLEHHGRDESSFQLV